MDNPYRNVSPPGYAGFRGPEAATARSRRPPGTISLLAHAGIRGSEATRRPPRTKTVDDYVRLPAHAAIQKPKDAPTETRRPLDSRAVDSSCGNVGPPT